MRDHPLKSTEMDRNRILAIDLMAPNATLTPSRRVWALTDAAFAKLPSEKLSAILADNALLTKILITTSDSAGDQKLGSEFVRRSDAQTPTLF